MADVTILTASRVEPSVTIPPHATIISRLGPTVAFAVRFQHIIASLSAVVCWQASVAASFSLATAAYATKILAFYALVTAKLGAFHGFTMSLKAAATVWDWKSTRILRAKLFYEFALFILGTGNGFILLLFWPGWLLLVGSYAAWYFCG